MSSDVSVVIPCYNAEKFIRESIVSCLKQTYSPVQIICVNDGSSDDTLRVLNEAKSEFGEIIVLKDQSNQGACAARNSGLREVSTEYVQFLDADDVLTPEKLASDMKLMAQYGADILVGSYEKIGLKNDSLGKVVSNPLTDEEIWGNLVLGDLGITSCNLYSAGYLKKKNISWDATLKSSQEYKLMFDILKTEPRIVFSEEVNTKVIRRDLESISSKNAEGNVIRWLELRKEILDYLKNNRVLFYEKVRNETEAILFDRIRLLASYNLELAVELKRNMVQKGFTPKASANNTEMYVSIYKLLGFRNAERVKKLVGR